MAKSDKDSKLYPDPRCPKCGFTMCELSDDRKVSSILTMAVPNGNYRCFHCPGPDKPKETANG